MPSPVHLWKNFREGKTPLSAEELNTMEELLEAYSLKTKEEAEANAKTSSEASVKTEKEAREIAEALKANLASPSFTGIPKGPTATAKTSTEQLATTAFTQTAKSEAEAASVSSSQTGAAAKLEEWYFHTTKTTEDCTAELLAFVEAANAANATIVLPDHEITLTGNVSLGNVGNREWRMRGSGPNSVIVDKNTTSSCLSYIRSDGKTGKVKWDDFSIRLECQKIEHPMVALEELRTSHSRINVAFIGSGSGPFYKCLSALRLINMWEFSLVGSTWEEIIGHTVWYDCPTLNGGNADFGDTQSVFCSNGMLIRGEATTNDVQFRNTKWVNSNEGREFYLKLTSGIPAKGAKTITVGTGLSTYFSAGGCVLLFSAAGLDVMHLAATEPYNATTGALNFWDETTKEHAEYADLRVICCSNWSVISDFYCPAMNFLGTHMEKSPAFLKDTPAFFDVGCMISIAQKSNTGEPRGIYLAGKSSKASRFDNCNMAHPGGSEPAYAMVCPITPSPSAASGTPTFEINGVTSVENEVSTTHALWRPVNSPDGVYNSKSELPEGCKVRTSTFGTQRNTFKADSAFASYRIVSASTTAEDNDDVILCTTGNIEVKIPTLRNKRLIIKKCDATYKAIRIVPESGAIDGAPEAFLFMPNDLAVVYWDQGTKAFRILGRGLRQGISSSILAPMAVGGRWSPTGTTAIGKAFKAWFMRAEIPTLGEIKDFSIYNGKAEGETLGAIFDTGETTAGKYTPLWEGAAVKASGENKWQSLGAPAIRVYPGQQVMMAFMTTNTTATFGNQTSVASANAAELPANYIPARGEAFPKLIAFHEYTEAKWSAIAEAELFTVAAIFSLIARVE